MDPALLHRGLLDHGYIELAVTGAHAAIVADLPPHHRDPFARLLIAQARAESLQLITHDAAIALYAGPVHLV